VLHPATEEVEDERRSVWALGVAPPPAPLRGAWLGCAQPKKLRLCLAEKIEDSHSARRYTPLDNASDSGPFSLLGCYFCADHGISENNHHFAQSISAIDKCSAHSACRPPI
jgi:hypothetical protein